MASSGDGAGHLSSTSLVMRKGTSTASGMDVIGEDLGHRKQ
jgi:hypothetical protein